MAIEDTDPRSNGFTLVELLVVMVVVAVLAAIAIPVVQAQKTKAHQTAVKSDITAIVQEVGTYYVDQTGGLVLAAGSEPLTWQLSSGSTVVAQGRLSPGNAVGPLGSIVDATTYCVTVLSEHDGVRPWQATGSVVGPGDCS